MLTLKKREGDRPHPIAPPDVSYFRLHGNSGKTLHSHSSGFRENKDCKKPRGFFCGEMGYTG